MSELAHSDSWSWCGMRHVDRPEPNSMPERAMELLLKKVRLVFGEQDWSAWSWEAREYGTREPRVIAFAWCNGAWTRPRVSI